ncbi:hypothetical protein F2P56_033241 [Juglans regia]|uniref:F-box domain-containing protein n=2 Tax=Juglans regia TaxID=51240 RepID=A0A833TH02_JUGRE|nr:F-box protein At4g18380-like [Juglans regia]KAF5447711.1 hypothetical protein F2P56_033241 [Juglans regia]
MDSNQEDHFDRLPDAILLLICNKLLDAKTLIRCLSVSKRFASLIPQIDTVFLPLPRVVPDPKPRGGLPKKVFKVFGQNLVTKLVRFLHHIISARHATNFKPNHFLYHSPFGVLKNFNGVKALHLELPCIGCDMEFDGGEHSLRLLKWKAEFGEELKSCVILGATSFERKKLSSTNSTGNEVRDQEEQEQECFQPYLGEEVLKSRIMSTISCLVSASVRHYLLKEIVAKCRTLQSVVVTDASKQGKLCMAKEQIVELRNIITMNSMGTSSERTPIPNSCMKLWYEPVMEFPASGIVMKGVTVALIRPVNGGVTRGEGKSDGDLLVGDLDGEEDHEDKAVFGEAVGEMVKRKTKFVMELSSF